MQNLAESRRQTAEKEIGFTLVKTKCKLGKYCLLLCDYSFRSGYPTYF